MNDNRDHEVTLMYLPGNQWSPRYDSTFYTVKLEGFTFVRNNPPTIPNEIRGKTNLPAYYYTIKVHREHEKHVVLRRYCHFRWLYEQWLSHPPVTTLSHPQPNTMKPIQIPSGTCPFFHWQDEKFATNRQELLSQFMEDVLGRPGYANHPATKVFLEL